MPGPDRTHFGGRRRPLVLRVEAGPCTRARCLALSWRPTCSCGHREAAPAAPASTSARRDVHERSISGASQRVSARGQALVRGSPPRYGSACARDAREPASWRFPRRSDDSAKLSGDCWMASARRCGTTLDATAPATSPESYLRGPQLAPIVGRAGRSAATRRMSVVQAFGAPAVRRDRDDCRRRWLRGELVHLRLRSVERPRRELPVRRPRLRTVATALLPGRPRLRRGGGLAGGRSRWPWRRLSSPRPRSDRAESAQRVSRRRPSRSRTTSYSANAERFRDQHRAVRRARPCSTTDDWPARCSTRSISTRVRVVHARSSSSTPTSSYVARDRGWARDAGA